MDYMGRVYGDQSRVKVLRAWVYMYIYIETEMIYIRS